MNANLLNLLNFMMPQASTTQTANTSAQPNTAQPDGLFAQQLAAILGNSEGQSVKNIDITDQLLAKFGNLDQPLVLNNLASAMVEPQTSLAFNPEQLAQQLEFAIAQIMKQLTNGQTTTEKMPDSIRTLFASMLEQLKQLDIVNPQATETQMWMSVKAVTVSVQQTKPNELQYIKTEQHELVQSKSNSAQTGDTDMWFKVRITVISITAWQSFTGLQSGENYTTSGTAPECVPASLLKANPNLTEMPDLVQTTGNNSLDPTSNAPINLIESNQTNTNQSVTLLDQIKQLAPQMKALNGEMEILVDKTQPSPEIITRSAASAIETEPIAAEQNTSGLITNEPLLAPAKPVVDQTIPTTSSQSKILDSLQKAAAQSEFIAESEIIAEVEPKTSDIEASQVSQDNNVLADETAPVEVLPKIIETTAVKDTTIGASINSPKPNIQAQPQSNTVQLPNANTQPQTLSFEQLLNQIKPSTQAVQPGVGSQPSAQIPPNLVTENVIRPLINPQPLELNPALPESIQPIVKPTTPTSPNAPVTKLTDLPHADLKMNTLMNSFSAAKAQQFGHNLTLPPAIDEIVKFSGVGIVKPSINTLNVGQLAESRNDNAYEPKLSAGTPKPESSEPALRELRNDNTVMFAPRFDVELHNQRRTLTEATQTLRQELINLHDQAQGDTRTSSPVREITLKLDPPNLGEMTARMQVKGGELIVQLQVANSQTRDLLERELQTLRAQLKDSGISGAQIKVELHSERHGQSHQGNQWNNAQQQGSSGSGNRQHSSLADEQLPESVIQTNSIWALLEPTTTSVGVNLYNDPNAKYI